MNNPKVAAYYYYNKNNPKLYGVSLNHYESNMNSEMVMEPLIRLSDHEKIVNQLKKENTDA